MNIAQNVERGRQSFPNKPALIFEDQLYTYRELDEQASRVAHGLHTLGIRSGQRVALFLPNLPEFIFTYLGIQKIGAVAVSVNASLHSKEVAFILRDSGSVAVITTKALRREVSEQEPADLQHVIVVDDASGTDVALSALMADASPIAHALTMTKDAPAAIVYTSGTTGFPKGATLSHGNIISNMQAKKRYCGMTPADRILLFVPLFHCFGQNAVMNSALDAGATIVLHRTFNPSQILHSIQDNRVTMFFGVPTTFILLFDRLTPQMMGAVHYYFSAAAPLPLEIAQKWQAKFGIPIHQGYGLTETSPFSSYNHLADEKPGSIGVAIEGVEMKIVDIDNGTAVALGELGEIVIRGANVMLGYWNQPDATAAVIQDGWFHTGDIGRRDEDGFFYIVDRLKDMINVAGMKVYPAEVENIIYQHPAVQEAAVYGIPHAIMGESVKASIVLKPGQTISAEDLMLFCRRQLATFKAPSAVDFVDAIPKNPTGKILKRTLRQTSDLAPTIIAERISA